MVDGQDGGRHEPGQAEDGADDDQEGHHEQVQVVTAAFLLKQKQLYWVIYKLHNVQLMDDRAVDK